MSYLFVLNSLFVPDLERKLGHSEMNGAINSNIYDLCNIQYCHAVSSLAHPKSFPRFASIWSKSWKNIPISSYCFPFSVVLWSIFSRLKRRLIRERARLFVAVGRDEFLICFRVFAQRFSWWWWKLIVDLLWAPVKDFKVLAREMKKLIVANHITKSSFESADSNLVEGKTAFLNHSLKKQPF